MARVGHCIPGVVARSRIESSGLCQQTRCIGSKVWRRQPSGRVAEGEVLLSGHHIHGACVIGCRNTGEEDGHDLADCRGTSDAVVVGRKVWIAADTRLIKEKCCVAGLGGECEVALRKAAITRDGWISGDGISNKTVEILALALLD